MYKIVTAGTLMSFRQSVQEMFDNGWDWVDGGGSVGVDQRSGERAGKSVGGFWAVMEYRDVECGDECDGCDCVTATDKTQGAGLTVEEIELIMERAMMEAASHVV